jgi:outer membrane receptor protein involved in Fe transport
MRKRLLTGFLLIGLGIGSIFAGTTGKIAGEIIDQDTQQPLIGSNVIIEGTMLGAATAMDGYYNILNIPPGVYSLRATMMGYKPMVMQNVRVSIDQTTQINFSLTPTVIETEEAVTVTAERELVRQDMTGSMASVGADEIAALPVNNMGQVLNLQAGIVRDNNGDIHIRGGRSGEVAYWVDGVAATDVYQGGMGVAVENSAIQELQVVSGTFNAEYGQAMSGIVNIITKEGTPKYTGEVMAYVGDYVSNSDKWNMLTGTHVGVNPVNGNVKTIGEEYNPIKEEFNPSYNTEFNLSGPVPFLGKDVTFFANSRYQSTEGYVYGARWYTPQGNPGDSAIMPLSPYWRYSGQAKLTWRMNSNLKLSYNVFYNKSHNDRTYNSAYRYVPDATNQNTGTGTTHILAWNHVLSPKTFYEARITRFYNESKSYLYDDPLATCRYLAHVTGGDAVGIADFDLDPNTAEGQALLQYAQDNRLTITYYPDPNGPAGYVHSDSLAAPASYSFNRSGTSLNRTTRSTAYWIGKFDLTSQVHRAHQVKTGFEGRYYEMKLDSYTLTTAVDGTGTAKYPFEPAIPDYTTINRSLYTRNPYEMSAYVQDKIELKEINVNVGVRFDYFNSNTNVPTDPRDPSIYYPFKNKNIYKNYVEPPADWTAQQRNEYLASLTKYTPEERRAFMQKAADATYAISPRLGIAYPITDRGVIHFSYGHFFQTPNLDNLYSNPDFKLSESGGNQVFGNPALKPQRTVQYEIGLQQQIAENLALEVSLFYRDIRDWVGTSPKVQIPERMAVTYSQYENKEYANVRGVTFKLDKRYADNFSAGVDYTFQVAEGTYSNPIDAINAINANQEPRKAIVPLSWDQRHTVNGRLVYRFGSWMASFIGRFQTGLPYTPSIGVGEVVGPTAVIGLKEMSSRWPSQKNLDFTLNKEFTVSGMMLNVFMNIFNVFDIRDETNGYSDTGSADYTTTVRPNDITYDAKRIGSIENFMLNPYWYTAPRQIQLGLSVGF